MVKVMKPEGDTPQWNGRSWKMGPCDQYEGLSKSPPNPGLGVPAATIRAEQTAHEMNKTKHFVKSQFPQRKGGGY